LLQWQILVDLVGGIDAVGFSALPCEGLISNGDHVFHVGEDESIFFSVRCIQD